MKNRSKTDIIASILESANGNWIIGSKISQVSSLSHKQLKDYATFLVENGLLEYNPDNQTYKTTAKGIEFLNIYHKIDQLIQ